MLHNVIILCYYDYVAFCYLIVIYANDFMKLCRKGVKILTNQIGQKLKTLRKGRKLTQQELADKLNITRATVSNYEVGRRSPHLSELKRIAEFFNVDLSFFGVASKDEIFDLLSRAKEVFENEEISKEKKQKVFDELMKLYINLK